jgi:hypothetical protein
MARAKYKIGTFVKVAENDECPALFGAVEEIRITSTGVMYKVTGDDNAVAENDIATAYREVAQRKVKTSAKGRATSKKSKSAENSASA